nr:uncharacterized protein LOC128704701 [Cherax quadricarinatus]
MEKEDKKRIYANYLEALVKRRLSIRRRRSLEIKRGGVHRNERLLELQNEWDRIDVLWKKAVETGNTPGTVVNQTESNDAQLGGVTGNEDERAGRSASVGTSQRGGAAGGVDTSVPINEDDERATTSHDVSDSNVAHNSGGEDERATTSHDVSDSNVAHNSGGEDERATTSHDVSVSNVVHNSGGEDERPEIITYIQNFRGDPRHEGNELQGFWGAKGIACSEQQATNPQGNGQVDGSMLIQMDELPLLVNGKVDGPAAVEAL